MNGVVQAANQTTSESMDNSGPAKPSHTTSFFETSRRLERSSRRTDVSPWDGKDPAILGTYDTPLERFYCEDDGCGRGFSSKTHLKLHRKFFHLPKVSSNFTLTAPLNIPFKHPDPLKFPCQSSYRMSTSVPTRTQERMSSKRLEVSSPLLQIVSLTPQRRCARVGTRMNASSRRLAKRWKRDQLFLRFRTRWDI